MSYPVMAGVSFGAFQVKVTEVSELEVKVKPEIGFKPEKKIHYVHR